jgi:hypothetical protein
MPCIFNKVLGADRVFIGILFNLIYRFNETAAVKDKVGLLWQHDGTKIRNGILHVVQIISDKKMPASNGVAIIC